MTTVWPEWNPPRLERRFRWRFLVVSLALHLQVLFMIEALRYLREYRPEWLPTWLQAAAVEEVVPETTAEYIPEPDEIEVPMRFVEVDPEVLSIEEPDFSEYYSTAATLAANPEVTQEDLDQPAFDGTREESSHTFTVRDPSLERPEVLETVAAETEMPLTAVQEPEVIELLDPAPEDPVETPPQAVASVEGAPADPVELLDPEEPVAGEPVGDLARATVQELPTDTPEQVEIEVEETPARRPGPLSPLANRPFRSLSEAREAKGILVGEKLKQEGGSQRFQIQSSLNVRSSPYADYDRQFIYAVQQHWYHLLSRHRYSLDRTGKVVLRFKLLSNGTISDLDVVHSDVGDIWSFICESAVLSPAPYARWPAEMHHLIGEDHREVTFTFHYH